MPVEEDLKKLANCHIAVGAPGRVKHLIESQHLKVSDIKLLVLDEADKLMDQSFQTDINQIFHKLPIRKQVIATSATYPDQLDNFLARYMHCPTYISAEVEGPLLLGLKQFVSIVKAHANVVQQLKLKNEQLNEILSRVSFTQCLVFTNYQTRAESISNLLNQKGWSSTFVSAAQDQKKRLEAVDSLKKFNCRILLSTDLTARGIDAANVDLVINYDVPYDAATYLHRMGRAGRYGSRGICITICSDGKEMGEFKHILGVVAGPTVKIARLDQIPSDLWDCDYNSFEMIEGSLNEGQMDNVKRLVIHMKPVEKNKGKKKKKNIKNGEDNLEFDTDTAKEILNNNANGDVNTEMSKMDLLSLLQSISADLPPHSENENRTTSTEKPELIEQNKRNEVLQKNLSLYNVTKLLASGPNNFDDVTDNVVTSLENSLKTVHESDVSKIHNSEETFTELSSKELLSNMEGCVEEAPLTDENALEQVFQFAYTHSCKDTKKHWLSYFSKELQQQFDEFCNPPQSSSEEEDEEEDDGDYEEYMNEVVEEYEIYNETEEASLHDKQEPERTFSERLEETEQNEPYTGDFVEQFSSYFGECTRSLQETALTFEDLASFDSWFYYQWQTQVCSVRDFVRQNIYVREMSSYQSERLNK